MVPPSEESSFFGPPFLTPADEMAHPDANAFFRAPSLAIFFNFFMLARRVTFLFFHWSKPRFDHVTHHA